jgi:hypothetical protein
MTTGRFVFIHILESDWFAGPWSWSEEVRGIFVRTHLIRKIQVFYFCFAFSCQSTACVTRNETHDFFHFVVRIFLKFCLNVQSC